MLRLAQVRRWRVACHRLAQAFDRVLRHRLRELTGALPW
jgi:hypothetical protein